MAELFAAVQNDEIELNKAKTLTGIASAIIHSCKVEIVNNQIIGNTAGIDFVQTEEQLNQKKLAAVR